MYYFILEHVGTVHNTSGMKTEVCVVCLCVCTNLYTPEWHNNNMKEENRIIYYRCWFLLHIFCILVSSGVGR